MLGKLFGGREKSGATAPEGRRLYAIGDVHGCLDRLDALIAKIDAEPAEGLEKRLIFLGDYVDRGPDSRGVLDRLIAVKAERPETVFLIGNHEEAMADFLDAPDSGERWLDWGGGETLASYGVSLLPYRDLGAVAEDFRAALPAAHSAFLSSLALFHLEGGYFFVHAGVRPGVPLEAQERKDLLLIRREFHDAPAEQRPDKVIVHGHHPARKPVDAGWRIGVDTGACFGGPLTAVALEGAARRFISV